MRCPQIDAQCNAYDTLRAQLAEAVALLRRWHDGSDNTYASPLRDASSAFLARIDKGNLK